MRVMRAMTASHGCDSHTKANRFKMGALDLNVFLLVVNELVLLATPIGGQSGPL